MAKEDHSVSRRGESGESPQPPVWQTALEVSLARGFANEVDLVRVYSAAAEHPNDAELRTLLERVMSAYQARRGQIQDLFIPVDHEWGVIRTVLRRPRGLPVFTSSTVDTVFDIEEARPPGLARVYSELSDLSIKSDNTLRGADQIGFANEVGYAFQNLLAEVDGAAGREVESGTVSLLAGEVVRLRENWATAVKRGIPITTLEGMALGLVGVVVVASVVAAVLAGAHIAAFRASTFIGIAVGGALGAVISVLSRMSAGTFRVPVETARTTVRLLAAIRPLVGAAFGVVVVFGLIGELLGLQTVVASDRRFYAYFVFAFLGGFSERWSRNLLAGVAGRLETGPEEDSSAPHGSSDPQLTGSRQPDEPVS